jgi:alkylation response protein AidB-like acyl-CoA dehydrogenase
MDLSLSDEEREIRDWVRTFVAREIMPLEPMVLGRERRHERGLTREELRALRDKPSSRASSACRRPRSTAAWRSGR